MPLNSSPLTLRVPVFDVRFPFVNLFLAFCVVTQNSYLFDVPLTNRFGQRSFSHPSWERLDFELRVRGGAITFYRVGGGAYCVT